MRALEAGTILDGRYRVDEPIGSGGFATVYAGFHLTLGVRVAIKVLHLGEEASPKQQAELIAAFVDEARVVTRLRHDHVVRTLDQGVLRADGSGGAVPYVVLEWCGDESLKQRLHRERGAPLSLGEAYAIVDAISDAMAHAHGLGIVHRDLKPANVMLAHGPDGAIVPRVIDFGIAKLFESDERTTSGQTLSRHAGQFTPAYAAPEQLAGRRTGPWTDVHAIGLLFYEMITGQSPFASPTSLGGVDPERPTPARCGVDVGAFEAVVARAVALRPSDRYADAGELRRALHAAATEMRLSIPSLRVATSALANRASAPRLDATIDDGATTEMPTSQTARTGDARLMRASDTGPTKPRRGSTWITVGAFAAIAATIATGVWWSRSASSGTHAASPSVEPTPSTNSAPETPPPPAPTPTLASPAASSYEPPSSPSSSSSTVNTAAPPKIHVGPKHPPTTPSTTAAPEPSHAPSATAQKGVGGIVENPPF